MDRGLIICSKNRENGPPAFSQSIKLSNTELGSSEDVAPKWVQVSKEGQYLGYLNGEAPFTFTKAVFDQVVANIRKHPSYKSGTDGYGCERVVPWDFEHASTFSPASGSISREGVPAQGWTYDFEVRKSESGYELWALTEFLEPAKTYIKNGQYQWASVVLLPHYIDPVSGEDVGANVMSIALTNTPFIEGMQKLVAGRNRIEDMDDIAEKARAQSLSWSGGGAMDFLKILSELLGVRATEDEVKEAVRDAVELRRETAKVLSAVKLSTGDIVAAATDAAGVREKYTALLKALGAENPDQALSSIVDLINQAEQLKAVMPELESLRTEVKQAEDTAAEADVAEVMNSRNLPQEMREALVLFRKNNKEEFGKKFPKLSKLQTALLGDTAATSAGASKNSGAPDSSDSARNLNAVDVTAFDGPDLIQKTLSYAKANKLTDGKSYESDFKFARELVRAGKVFVRN